MKRALKYAFWLALGWFVLHTAVIVADGLNDTTTATEAAIIFGTTVHENGQLSARLQARLNRGLKLYNDGLVAHIIVSGGLGKEGHLEGSKMAEYLQQQGIPKTNITIDNEGNTTRLTADTVVRLHPKLSSVTVVTQYFHVSRARLAMQQAGIAQVEGAAPNYFELRDVYSTVREFFGFYKYWLEGGGSST